ncbi:hypothetical protein D9M71_570530 [compost metagenome]
MCRSIPGISQVSRGLAVMALCSVRRSRGTNSELFAPGLFLFPMLAQAGSYTFDNINDDPAMRVPEPMQAPAPMP